MLQPGRVVGQEGEACAVGIVYDQIVRQKIVIAVDLQIVGRLRLQRLDLHHFVPMDI